MSDFETDELASAYLDDAVTDEERARVDADPSLLARVAELRQVRNSLRASTVEPTSAAARDMAIESALTISSVVDFDAERRRRRVRIASIAAAVLLLIGAGGVLLRSVTESSSTKFSAAAKSASAPTTTVPTTSVVVNGVLGAYPSRDALVASVQSSLRFALSTTAAGAANDNAAPKAAESSSASRCATTPDNATSQLYTENATLEGSPVQIDVYALADGSRRVVVTASGTCTLVFSQAL